MSFGQAQNAGLQARAPMQFVRMFSTDGDVYGNRTPCQHLRDLLHPSGALTEKEEERPAACDHVLDILAGKAGPSTAESARPIVAAKVVVDSHQRVLITEPTAQKVHILDFAHRKYLQIDGAKGDRMSVPFGIAVDADDSIYVTDLKRGKIAVYGADGKFIKYIGDLKGEGDFDTPRSIAIDRATGRIYLTDTKRDFVIILDRDGKMLAQVGKRGGGTGPAEFKEPAEIAIYANEVFVLDRQNSRIQVLDLDGNFRRELRLAGAGGTDGTGMAFDSQGRMIVPARNRVEVFNRDGGLLFRFGDGGDLPGQFQNPQGVCTDSKDRVYITDTGNRRIQVFQLTKQPAANTEAAR